LGKSETRIECTRCLENAENVFSDGIFLGICELGGSIDGENGSGARFGGEL